MIYDINISFFYVRNLVYMEISGKKSFLSRPVRPWLQVVIEPNTDANQGNRGDNNGRSNPSCAKTARMDPAGDGNAVA